MNNQRRDLDQLKHNDYDAREFRAPPTLLPLIPQTNLVDFNANYSSTPIIRGEEAIPLKTFAEFQPNNHQNYLPVVNNHQHPQPFSTGIFQSPNPIPFYGASSIAAAARYHQYLRSRNTQFTSTHNSVSAPALRHILTRFEPSGLGCNRQTLPVEGELIPKRIFRRDNHHPRSVTGKKPVNAEFMMSIAQTIIKIEPDEEVNGDSLKPTTVNFSRMERKKKHYPVEPEVSTFSSGQLDQTQKKYDVRSNMTNIQKRKRTNNQGSDGATRDDVKKPKNIHMLSRVHQNKNWIMEGVIVKSIRHDKPMGTIIRVNEDKTTCVLQFFSGWRAEILTKFISPVSASDN